MTTAEAVNWDELRQTLEDIPEDVRQQLIELWRDMAALLAQRVAE